jgi:lipopolysaccharide transport system ATP-binding protein
VDEVLAVGDAQFQKKCLGKMGDVAKEGRTVLFVSHNMVAIQSLCTNAMLLREGRVEAHGQVSAVINQYLRASAERSEKRWPEDSSKPGDDAVKLVAVRVLTTEGEKTNVIQMHEDFQIEIEYQIDRRLYGLQVGFRLLTSDGTVVLTSGDNDSSIADQGERNPGRYISRCLMPGRFLSPQTYFLSVGAHVPNVHTHFYVESPVSFTVARTDGRGTIADDKRLGVICPILPWRVTEIRGDDEDR